ncbi:Glu/Leu/Phe/Val dehydrogenase dimerization domain-containing protein [Desulfovibrio sp. Fe33]|uniref:Glu/Leu/Phe/Val dehydrogenase dimerization domain-containing protein n=1 Tax=Desulfovibrio sp. Fe33 TaxID=3020842 RepID=UPI00234CA852|nr:Glu/Leu/Phe/Val dehydrogenase dimerization domain-containing protein [Desulfovibrio sp. Fe33]
MKELLKTFEQKQPEIVFEWNDAETEAKGWLVINSLRGGAAGGGTRMRKGLDKHEVVSLAKTMEIKFAVSGPQIGGAKSGIDFDPADPRKVDVLKRWYKAVMPLLKNYYGTGGDMNICEVKDVIPITEGYGLWHPQEGIVNGHFHPTDMLRIQKISQLRGGVSMPVTSPKYAPDSKKKYLVADLITGWGVAESVRHLYGFRKQDLEGKRVIVQGWGNVGGTAAYYLAANGARIVGIIDRNAGLVKEEGLTVEEVRELLLKRTGNTLVGDDLLTAEETQARVWSVGADIFLPCAASRLVTRAQVETMKDHGLEVIACGANVPFIDEDIFFGETAEYADSVVDVIPDFIANCGMARAFNYLMSNKVDLDADAIFQDVSDTIRHALEETMQHVPERNHLSAAAMENVLHKLMA